MIKMSVNIKYFKIKSFLGGRTLLKVKLLGAFLPNDQMEGIIKTAY